MAEIKRIGFGQVEPNHLSAQKTGQIYAQLPADDAIAVLENGQFVKYDLNAGKVNFTGKGEWMMVFNEIKLYDNTWRQSYKDFAQVKALKDQMVPRVIKINVGDIFTTNCLGVANTSGTAEVTCGTFAVGDVVAPDSATGYLTTAAGASSEYKLEVVKVYTLPDGQAAVKLVRIT